MTVVATNVSLGEMGAMSDESRHFVAGFLAGSQPGYPLRKTARQTVRSAVERQPSDAEDSLVVRARLEWERVDGALEGIRRLV